MDNIDILKFENELLKIYSRCLEDLIIYNSNFENSNQLELYFLSDILNSSGVGKNFFK